MNAENVTPVNTKGEHKMKLHGVGQSSNMKNVVSISPVVMRWNNMRRDHGKIWGYRVKDY